MAEDEEEAEEGMQPYGQVQQGNIVPHFVDEQYETGYAQEETPLTQRSRISLAGIKAPTNGEQPALEAEQHGEEENKDYRQLWKWAYREACKQAGIPVGLFELFYCKC